jgi:hypothetical protein
VSWQRPPRREKGARNDNNDVDKRRTKIAAIIMIGVHRRHEGNHDVVIIMTMVAAMITGEGQDLDEMKRTTTAAATTASSGGGQDSVEATPMMTRIVEGTDHVARLMTGGVDRMSHLTTTGGSADPTTGVRTVTIPGRIYQRIVLKSPRRDDWGDSSESSIIDLKNKPTRMVLFDDVALIAIISPKKVERRSMIE